MAFSEELYNRLTTEEDARLCDDIPESACREAPQSFALLLASNLLTKLGDAIASPKTTLAWATSALGTPAYVLAFLVPIRESGSLIPQLFIGGVIRQLSVRKWVWVAGSVAQCLCIAGIGVTVLTLDGAHAGWAILMLITLFALARGFSSVAAKDVLGKTIPKPKRGQLNGWTASAAGLLTVGVGVTLMLPVVNRLGDSGIGLLIIAAGLLWLVAAAIYSNVPEVAGETAGGRNAKKALSKLRILVTDKPFRRFVTTRALLMCSALSAPYYVALAHDRLGSSSYLLGAFVAAAGTACLVSAPFWGRFADLSSKQVMIAAAITAAGIGIATLFIDWLVPQLAATIWFLPLAYFVLSVAHSGVRVGRKTYVVNLASGNQRTDYVAISNTVIGVLLLVVGILGTLAAFIGNAGVIGLLALMGLTGAAVGRSLPEI